MMIARTEPIIRALAVAGVLLSLALTGSTPAAAQVAVSPDTVAVTLAGGDTTTVRLTVSPGTANDVSFALSLAPAPRAGDPPEPPGTLLFATAPSAPITDVYDFTMTPDGRLFGAASAGRNETVELTPSLEVVRKFPHPTTDLLSLTGGVTFDAEDGDNTLWWLDLQGDALETEQALLLKGTIDGTPTGRSLAVPFAETGRCGFSTGRPWSLIYESAAESGEDTPGVPRFYFHDIWNFTIWAVDTLGVPLADYPVPMTDYAGRPAPFNPDGCLIPGSLDAHALSSDSALAGEPVFEVLTGYPSVHPQNRVYTVVVTDRAGKNRGAETPVFDLEPPDGVGNVLVLNGVVRSRVDPSVLYVKALTGFVGNTRIWVLAVRAAPLPPVWLDAAPILFETEGGADTTLVLSLDATGLAPGVYEAVASVREVDGIGEVLVDIPVTLTVAPVESEDGPVEPELFQLGEPYPNPATTRVTVPFSLGKSAEVRVTVLNVLGRAVAILKSDFLEAGEHTMPFDTAKLPSGIYLLHGVAGAQTLTQRFTVIR